MTLRPIFALILLIAAMLSAPASAQRAPNITPALVAEQAEATPGSTVMLALVMTPAPTWHGYWENPGDAGIGMSFRWTLPAGASTGEARHPVPETLLIAGIMNHVYEGEYALLIPFTLPRDARIGEPLTIALKADWLACTDEICVPETGNVSTNIMVAAAPGAPARAFDEYRRRLPAPLGADASYEVAGERLRIGFPLPAGVKLGDLHFFIREDGVIGYPDPQIFRRDGDRLILDAALTGEVPESLTGILRIGDHEGFEITAKAGSVPLAGEVVKAVAGGDLGNGADGATGGAGAGGWTLFFAALGGALIGGLILNIMPCVFPILSLKALSLARAGGDERQVRREAMAYAAGVVLFCLMLGALMLGLRAGGAQIGWAFQLQEPMVVAALFLLVLAITLNLAGVFDLTAFGGGQALADKGGAKGAFWTGALAALVATPCTGPFMAAAMGSALILPPALALIVFAGLGLGLALPFLAIAFVPMLRARLPRPGPWMETLRRVMAVPMALTALALLWLLGQQGGRDLMLAALAGGALLAAALWWLGRGQRSGGTGWLAGGMALAASIACLALLPATPANDARARAVDAAPDMLASQPFDAARLAELRAANTPVFAYFTADWCITCKANEAVALNRDDTAKAFRAANIAVLRGDWTRRDAHITRFLEQQGVAGVPLYVLYAPGKEPEILPQILTSDILVGKAKAIAS